MKSWENCICKNNYYGHHKKIRFIEGNEYKYIKLNNGGFDYNVVGHGESGKFMKSGFVHWFDIINNDCLRDEDCDIFEDW